MTEHRLITLFGSDGVPARDWVPPVGDAGHVIFPVEGSRDAMDQLQSQLPMVIAHTEHPVDSLTMTHGTDPRRVDIALLAPRQPFLYCRTAGVFWLLI